MADHQDVYSRQELHRWATREGMEPSEEFLFDKYLDSAQRTLEAGCGGGRIMRRLLARGFTDLHGFDYVPAMVDAARERDPHGQIDYQVQDARALTYSDHSFDQLIYFGQVLCFISNPQERRRAMAEAFRILRPGGTALFSFLSFRDRQSTLPYRLLLRYLRLLRLITFRPLSVQNVPWLKLNSRPNFAALLDRGPYIYFYREREAYEELTAAGFQVVGIGSDADIETGGLPDSVDAVEQRPFRKRLYVVCRK